MFKHLAYLADSEEPVLVGEARVTCKIDDAILDADLLTTIEAAREQAEHITGRFYRQQVLRGEFASWPCGAVMLLAVCGVSAVAISYRSAAQPDDWTLLDASQYRWSETGIDTRVERRSTVPAWPELALPEYGNRVRIDLTVGLAAGVNAPACVRRFILAHAAAWSELPAAQRLAGGVNANPLFERLLDREKLWR